MNPAGVILTYVVWKDWKQWWFNIPLLIGQLAFLIVGTAYGKIKWPKLDRWQDRIIGVILTWVFIPFIWFLPKWWSIPPVIIGVFVFVATVYRNIPWRRVWRAAQCSHVRLCLRKRTKDVKLPGGMPWPAVEGTYDYMNFGWEFAEIQPWRLDQCKGQFEYRNPTFETSPEFIAAMIEYAEAQVGKGYDDLQLISNGLHLIAWIVMPWRWGKELKIIKAFNRKGGREHCTSGFVACLRWGDVRKDCSAPVTEAVLRKRGYVEKTKYFTSYDTAVIPPCLVAIDGNWREK